MERFKTRLTAKSCVIFVAVTQIILRLIVTLCERVPYGNDDLLTLISLPFYAMMAFIVCFNTFFSGRLGQKL